jgi:hypothetical protein
MEAGAGAGGKRDAVKHDANWLREAIKQKEVLCFLDIDIDGAYDAYKRAEAFVAANDLTYGFSSKQLSKLGGSERSRIQELYEADYEWSQKGGIQLNPPNERVVIKIDPTKCPLASENFIAICDGFKGKGSSGKPLHYKGCPFHRIVKGFVAQVRRWLPEPPIAAGPSFPHVCLCALCFFLPTSLRRVTLQQALAVAATRCGARSSRTTKLV